MKRLVIDTETTGLSPRFHKTLTVGLLLIDVEKSHLNILDQNHIFIKHNHYNASKGAMSVNKIDLIQHNQIAVPPQKACNQINNFIEKNILHETPLVGHNIQFDRGFLNSLFDQATCYQNSTTNTKTQCGYGETSKNKTKSHPEEPT